MDMILVMMKMKTIGAMTTGKKTVLHLDLSKKPFAI
jgi:hypothetical protein